MVERPINDQEASLLKRLKGHCETIIMFGCAMALQDCSQKGQLKIRTPDQDMSSSLIILDQALQVGLLDQLEFDTCKVEIDLSNLGLSGDSPGAIALNCGVKTLVETLQEMSSQPDGLKRFGLLRLITACA